MSKRIWFPVALGVTFAALTAAHMISRRWSDPPRPAATATDDEPSQLATPGAGASPFRTLSAAPPASTPVAAANPQAGTSDAGEARAVEGSPQAGERDQQMTKLRTSGPDALGLAAKVNPLQVAWETMANRSGIDVEVSP